MNTFDKKLFDALNRGKKKTTPTFNSLNRGASIPKQQQWKSFNFNTKKLMNKLYVDSDKDGVPNRWDCQPHNKFKQDDWKYSRERKINIDIELDETTGHGKGERESIQRANMYLLSPIEKWTNGVTTIILYKERMRSQANLLYYRLRIYRNKERIYGKNYGPGREEVMKVVNALLNLDNNEINNMSENNLFNFINDIRRQYRRRQ